MFTFLLVLISLFLFYVVFFFQAEDGIRDLVRSRGLGDVYKRQRLDLVIDTRLAAPRFAAESQGVDPRVHLLLGLGTCLLYTSDAADERSSVDLGGRRIIKKKNRTATSGA